MRESMLRRLEALEAIQRLRDGPMSIGGIIFGGPDFEIDATFAIGPGDFVCRREPGESLDDFKSRAFAECLASKPRVPRAILVFLDEEKEPPECTTPLTSR
jgi:hypothetical protein